MGFSGFADGSAKFFRALSRNMTREWFQAHKQEFELGYQQPMQALLEEVRMGADKAYTYCDLEEPKLFRIYRDVRFSKDKAPYKLHCAGVIATKLRGKVTEVPMALYFHVGQPNSFGAAGHYMMSPSMLQGFRNAVADDKRGKELDKLLASLKKKGFTTHSYGTYARVPKGFDPEHPRAEHLKRKGLTVDFPELPKGILASPKLVPWLVTQVKAAAPLVEWLVYATAS